MLRNDGSTSKRYSQVEEYGYSFHPRDFYFHPAALYLKLASQFSLKRGQMVYRERDFFRGLLCQEGALSCEL